MGSQAETSGGLLAKLSQEFDPLAFYAEIFATVNRARSNFEIKPGALITSTKDLGGGGGGESFVNAFYRVIGMPAISNVVLGLADPKQIANPYTTEQVFKIRSQSETLNFFNYDEVVTLESGDSFTPNTLFIRENALRAPDRFVNLGKTAEMQKRAVQFFEDPLDIGAANFRKPSMFPMVVAADVPIYPQESRVAPLFYLGDFVTDSGVRCPRSFLETVIYMRTFRFSGQTTLLEEELRVAIVEQLEDASPEVATGIVGQISEFGLLELQLVNKFIQAMQRSAVGFYRAREKLIKLRRQTTFTPVVVAADPNIKRGELSLSGDEVAGVVNANVDLQNKVFIEDIQVPLVDQAIANIKSELAKADIFISLLPTEQLKKADQIRRIGDENPTLSLTPDIFSNTLISILSLERQSLQKELENLESEKQVLKQQLDVIRKALQIYTGEPLGLSIFDVLAVFLALFTVDVSDLYGILNQGGKDRLAANTAFTTAFVAPVADANVNITDAASSVTAAATDAASSAASASGQQFTNSPAASLANIQAKVRDYLSLSSKFYTAAATVAEPR